MTELINEVISLVETNKLIKDTHTSLKKKYDAKQVDIVIACVSNDIESLKECIDKGYDLSICNGKILRYTVSNGFVELSVLLLKNKIEP